MTRSGLILGLCLFWAWTAMGGEKLLASFSADEMPVVNRVEKEAAQWKIGTDMFQKAEGKAAITLEHKSDESDSAWPFEAVITVPGNCVLWYEVTMCCYGDKKAYPEMTVRFPDGKSYFSRGLDQAFEGNKKGWRRCRIPFYLDAGEQTLTVNMGARCEGPGTVLLDDVRLVQRPRTWLGNEEMLGGALGMLGGFFGTLLGCWGGLTGYLIPRGRGRRFVMISGSLFLGMSVLILILGGVFFFSGASRAWHYPFLLTGGPLHHVAGRVASRHVPAVPRGGETAP